MEKERKDLLKVAAQRKVDVNKFWSTKKLAEVLEASKESRSSVVKRSWITRKHLFGNGFKKEVAVEAVA